jgi:hypothetical protein
LLLGPFLYHRLVWDNNGDQVGLKGVTIAEDLSDIEGLLELTLNLIRGNILTLSKLEDILLSIYNFKGAIWKEHANITSVNPAVLINGFAGLLWLTEITFEVVVALVADLPTGHRVASVRILIFTCVIHFWNINKFNIEAAVGATDMSRGRIS